ncbi:OsmC family protein [Algoriphagus sp. D3-2-R+10]|uniref:OsmC family protein n=1 Tax=Algoriphagus aurantiacus TaxID=3103948 RepID=UPI002B39CCA2|nr:OsmC family protein [Algoriphagus sp. D3-2-R+10]MEB2778640.1 OsmC family protein [Algoriphagus sp. D3-2-R+10]
MEALTKTTVNGFKSEEIVGTINAIQENPEIAKFEFRVRNKWITGGHNQATVKDFYGGCQEDTSREEAWVFNNGEPPILLGHNEGANPVEYLMSALSGCMTTTMALHAAARGIEIESIESKFEGDIDVQGFLGLNDQVRNGYQQIRVTFDIKGDLTDEQKQELIGFTMKSPVFDVVANGTNVVIGLA